MAIGSFNPEKNIAYLKYKELNPTNKKKHDAIFEQMKIHYANWQDAVEGANNKNLEQSIRNQLTIQAQSENGKYKHQLNQLTDLLAETHGETVKGQKITNKVKYNSKEITSAATEWLNAETIESKINRGEKVTAEDIKSSKVPEGVGGGSLGAAKADDIVFDDIKPEVENKLGLGAGALNVGAKILDPIGEVIEDAVLALGIRLGIPGIAVAFKALMFYEAANLVGTGIKLLGNKIGRESGAFEGPEYGDWDTELADNSIWGEMYDLIDEEEVKKLVEDPKNNWELTEEDWKDIQGYGERSVLQKGWDKIDKEFGFRPPSGPEMLSNALSGIKKITGGR